MTYGAGGTALVEQCSKIEMFTIRVTTKSHVVGIRATVREVDDDNGALRRASFVKRFLPTRKKRFKWLENGGAPFLLIFFDGADRRVGSPPS
jgi:hypothetical protein